MSGVETQVRSAPVLEATRPRLPWFLSVENRYLAPILVTGVLLAGQFSFGILESYPKTAAAIVSAILTSSILGRLVVGRWPPLSSAYITGISVGMLIRAPEVWPYVMCSVISITSRYAIRVRGRHLWNPSNLGVSAMLFLAPQAVAGLSIQWGNNVWPMLVIWLFGAAIIWRLRRLHICATYALSFVVFSVLRSYLIGSPVLAELSPVTGPMYQLFIFFMITDPATTVRRGWAQALVAFLVALAEMLLRLNEVVHAPFYALFLVGPVALLVEMWWDGAHPGPKVAGAALTGTGASLSAALGADAVSPQAQPTTCC